MERNNRLKELFYQNYNQLCNVAYKYLLDRDIAEDVVQETFIKFWEQKKDSLPDNEVGYYLTRAVKNNCISYLRKDMEVLSINENLSIENELTTDEEMEKVHEDRLEQLDQAILELPPKCRTVFILSKMEQKKYKEIAAMMNISVKTVENQMTKAIGSIRDYFHRNETLINLSKVPYNDHQ